MIKEKRRKILVILDFQMITNFHKHKILGAQLYKSIKNLKNLHISSKVLIFHHQLSGIFPKKFIIHMCVCVQSLPTRMFIAALFRRAFTNCINPVGYAKSVIGNCSAELPAFYRISVGTKECHLLHVTPKNLQYGSTKSLVGEVVGMLYTLSRKQL